MVKKKNGQPNSWISTILPVVCTVNTNTNHKMQKKKSKLQLSYISVYIRYVYHNRLEYNWIELILFFCFETRYFTNVYNNMYYAIPYLLKWEGGQIKSSPSPGTIKKKCIRDQLIGSYFYIARLFFFLIVNYTWNKYLIFNHVILDNNL